MTHHAAVATEDESHGRPARRLQFNRWRDPRLLLGVLLVTTSVLAGSYLFAKQDDTVTYWAVRDAVQAGERLEAESLRATSVRLDSSSGTRYLKVADELPAQLTDLVWAHDLAGGELVSDNALRAADSAGAELPLNVAAGHFPADLHTGDLVDVWVSPKSTEGSATRAKRVLSGVAVLTSGGQSEAMGDSLASTILVGVEENRVQSDVVASVSSGDITLVRLP